METANQLQRFFHECALLQAVLKYRRGLTQTERESLKFKIYDLLFQIEAHPVLPEKPREQPAEDNPRSRSTAA
jgi:hypothetical protein